MSLMSVAAARARILSEVEPLGSEPVAIYEARGRVLSETLAARRSQPPFPASAMDGYALRAADIRTVPAELNVIGQSSAGHRFGGEVKPGEAVRIFTGAPVPSGADTVVIQENTRPLDGGRVAILASTGEGRNIRPSGYDFDEGERLLSKGMRLEARHLMLAAAMSYAAVPVYRKPVVALLANGDELVPPGSTPGPDQIVSSIPAALVPAVAAWGGSPLLLGIARDNQESLLAEVAAGAKADILATIGGASVGEHDLVRKVLELGGAKFEVLKAAIRPGKPVMFGFKGGQRILSLPGNPVSAMVCALVFLKPLIERLSGLAVPQDASEEVPLLAPLDRNGDREHYMRGVRNLNGVMALADQDSSLIKVFAEANCLIVRPPHAPALPAGAAVPVISLTF